METTQAKNDLVRGVVGMVGDGPSDPYWNSLGIPYGIASRARAWSFLDQNLPVAPVGLMAPIHTIGPKATPSHLMLSYGGYEDGGSREGQGHNA